MDTIQIIKIDEGQILISYLDKIIKLDLKFDNLKDKIRKINYNVLDDYVKSGPSPNQLKMLKQASYELFNILNFFELKNFFKKIKKNKFNHIQLILDDDTNLIPFELLHDGKDFLSDYIIFSRSFINSKEYDSISKSDKTFTIVGNPSESNDIMQDINDEVSHISNLIRYSFDLKGPYTKRYVNKIELINLLNVSSYFHFSGHYIFDEKKSGWKLFDDTFTDSDILKISKSPKFLFSNSCGNVSENFISSFLEKGTKSIISSSGKLPSKQASEFSQKFYDYFIVENLNLGESFFLSRRDIINQYGKNDLFWCFYQIYGSSFLESNKKNNRKINKKSKSLYYLSFLLLALSALFIFSYFKNEQPNLDSRFILDQLIVKSNNKIMESSFSDVDTIKLNDESIYVIKPYGKSIYFKLINNQPIFSLNKDLKGLDLYMNKKDTIERLFDYNKDTLNLFFKNKKYNNDNKYYHINLQLSQFKNIKVYIKKIDLNISDYELYLFDQNNDRRYKILISQLIEMARVFKVITKDHLDIYADPQKSYFYHISDNFDLIKDNIEFNEELSLHIKKTLINIIK